MLMIMISEFFLFRKIQTTKIRLEKQRVTELKVAVYGLVQGGGGGHVLHHHDVVEASQCGDCHRDDRDLRRHR